MRARTGGASFVVSRMRVARFYGPSGELNARALPTTRPALRLCRAPPFTLLRIDGFRFDDQALAELYEILDTDLAPIELAAAYTQPLMEHSEPGKLLEPYPEHLRVYTDSFIELSRLLEEIRFEVALAALLLLDYTRKLDAGEAPAVERSPLPLTVDVMAMLRRYFREIPPPSELFSRPHSPLSGSRILSRWFAGQLLDSALYRTVAAADRLAILLWTRAELPLDTRGGRPIPAFRRHYLNRLAPRYATASGWDDLVGFVEQPLFETAKNLRDGFTHAQRIASQLHGDDRVIYGAEYAAGGTAIAAIDAGDHLAFGLAAYDAVLRPLVHLTGDLLDVFAER
jgi:hypothetical protein